MSMIEIHRSALESVVPAYHEFLEAQGDHKLCGIVEGSDDVRYYSHHLSPSIAEEGWRIWWIQAGSPKSNKDNVLQLLKLIDWSNHSRKQAAFFIDRDIDELHGAELPSDDNLYITEHYSIENDIATFQTFRTALLAEYLIQLTDSELAIVEQRFNDARQVVCNLVKCVMAWYLVAKEKDPSADYSAVKMKKLVRITECVATPVAADSNEVIAGFWRLDTKRDSPEFARKLNALQKLSEHYECVRGKFLAWFFIEFTKSFLRDCSKIIPRLGSCSKADNLGQDSFVAVFAKYSVIPDSLMMFSGDTYFEYMRT